MNNMTFNYMPTVSFITDLLPQQLSGIMLPYAIIASWGDHLLHQAYTEFNRKLLS